jgi:MFS family permease
MLTPLFLGWVAMSIAAARLTVRLGYRRIALAGSVLLTVGFIGLVTLSPTSPRTHLLAACLVMGMGMGASMLSLLLAVQHGVDRAHLGIATSLNQFSRSIGAAIGIAAMGALMSRALTGVELPGGPGTLGPAVVLTGAARTQFAAALHQVFLAGAGTAFVALIVTFFLPSVSFASVSHGAGEQMLAAEMTNLEPQDEPVGVQD